MQRVFTRVLIPTVCIGLAAAACGSDTSDTTATSETSPTESIAGSSTTVGADEGCFAAPALDPVPTEPPDGDTTITLLAHDSFAVSDDTLATFTAETGIAVEVVLGGDGGTLINQAVLAGDNPAGDVLFGIDNTFLCVGLENDVFVPYESPALDTVPSELRLDPHHRVTPIDYGDVCANYWAADFTDTPPPETLDDLIDPAYSDLFVTQNPETSSPGLAFLLATIARYGSEGWEEYWRALFDNGATVTNDWESAYYGEFIAGGGDRPLVMSYATSPAAEVLFADPPVEEAPTGVITDSCYRQIEFAGVLRGTDHPAAAAALVDFMLSTTFQEDIPLNMFVYPASSAAEAPAAFTEYAAEVDDPVILDAELVATNRNDWTDRWTAIRRE